MGSESDEAEDEIDWSRVPEGMARQIFGQGHAHLEAQLQVAVASDQRATTASSLFASIAAAVLAGTLAYWDKAGNFPILIAGLAGSVAMTIGAVMTLRAARPVDFYLPGNHPEALYSGRLDPLNVMLGSEAENYQHHISMNRDLLDANAKTFNQGTTIAVWSPFFAIAVWLAASLLFTYFSSSAATAPGAVP